MSFIVYYCASFVACIFGIFYYFILSVILSVGMSCLCVYGPCYLSQIKCNVMKIEQNAILSFLCRDPSHFWRLHPIHISRIFGGSNHIAETAESKVVKFCTHVGYNRMTYQPQKRSDYGHVTILKLSRLPWSATDELLVQVSKQASTAYGICEVWIIGNRNFIPAA